VLSELREYATTQPPPADASSVLESALYLEACNAIFERGILGKGAFIKTMDNPILKSMDSGYEYFTKWLDRKLEAGQRLHCIIVPYICIHFYNNNYYSFCSLQVTQSQQQRNVHS